MARMKMVDQRLLKMQLAAMQTMRMLIVERASMTKEEVAATLEAVQNIQSISQALQKSKENYNAKTVEQERLRKEGAAPRDVEKAGVKAKKATESYKTYVEKYAAAKSEFELKMAETAQVHKEFVNNMENTTVESLIQKLAESKGTGKERPGPIEFEECNTAIATEGAKPRKRKAFAIPGRRKDKDTDSTDSDDEDEPRKFHVEIKPVQPNNGNHQSRSSIDELKASIGNITLSPSASGQMKRNTSSEYFLFIHFSFLCQFEISRLANNDLLSLDPFAPPLAGSSSTVSSSAAEVLVHQEGSPFPISSPGLPWNLVDEPLLGLKPRPRAESAPPAQPDGSEQHAIATAPKTAPESTDLFSSITWSQSQWIAFNDELVPCKRPSNTSPREHQRPLSLPPAKAFRFFSDDPNDPYNKVACRAGLFMEESSCPLRLSPAATDDNAKPAANQAHNVPLQARPTTPLAVGTIVPPPRPSSRPKLPSGKLAGINEIVRPFSPPKTSNASPPPAAPLARAESSSSLSSTASLSAGNTPTVDEDAFVGKLPTFEKRSETPAGTVRAVDLPQSHRVHHTNTPGSACSALPHLNTKPLSP
ncbi:hypothetical protein JZ751_011807 [Albula glossodonta]|uniref:GMIP/FCHO2-like FCH domain-containing protein n=1 Tax=Albula glossodonta TaxID=121402 RepID=A0A8T2PQQ7_9TELE|nr:hypothetical protein JZ751_011807 [Albula glossodonta]